MVFSEMHNFCCLRLFSEIHNFCCARCLEIITSIVKVYSDITIVIFSSLFTLLPLLGEFQITIIANDSLKLYTYHLLPVRFGKIHYFAIMTTFEGYCGKIHDIDLGITPL